ncbi:MAG: phosphotransferase [Fimbriimonadaceae bacterium]|nr:phosphotransferase [Fimbriimonadaceae bacterium]
MDTADLERALRTFRPRASLGRAWELRGGISARMVAFESFGPDGPLTHIARYPGPYALQMVPTTAEREFEMLRRLRPTGVPVPNPRFLSPEPPTPFYVVDYIEGAPELNPNDVDAFLVRFAEGLAAIHRVDHEAIGIGDSLPMPSKPRPRPAVGNADLREDDVWAALEGREPVLNPPVLRHGDYWPGNVIWRDGEIVGVVDWESAAVGEPLRDLAVSRLDTLWILGPEAMATFTRHYLSLIPLDATSLPYWDLRAALRPMENLPEWAATYPSFGRPDVTTETMRAHLLWLVERALQDSAARKASS